MERLLTNHRNDADVIKIIIYNNYMYLMHHLNGNIYLNFR